MKKINNILIGIAVLLVFGVLVNSAEARTVSVRSYYRPSTNSYVMPSYRTSPNRIKMDNYSTKGNYNPYSGKVGTKNPYKW